MKTSTKTLRNNHRIRTLTAVGLFSALAYVGCVLFHFRASFLTFDLKDAVMSVGAMIFGPLYGVAMALIVALIEALTISSTGVYGFIMNVLSSCTFVGIGSLIYSRKRTIIGAVIGILSASVATVTVMMLANLLITPFYMNVTRGDVAAMIPTILLPFNLTKTIFNSAVVFIIYKPIITAMRSSGFIVSGNEITNANNPRKRSFIVTLIALAVAVIALLFFFVKLGGSFALGNN